MHHHIKIGYSENQHLHWHDPRGFERNQYPDNCLAMPGQMAGKHSVTAAYIKQYIAGGELKLLCDISSKFFEPGFFLLALCPPLRPTCKKGSSTDPLLLPVFFPIHLLITSFDYAVSNTQSGILVNRGIVQDRINLFYLCFRECMI
jgi:hypothetical protein